MWGAVDEMALEAYEAWNASGIRPNGLQAPLIDRIASIEAQKISLKHGECPICQEAGVPFHGSSPKVFQLHCKCVY
jgi:hypothetical protein